MPYDPRCAFMLNNLQVFRDMTAGLDLNPQFKHVLQLIKEGQQNLFITGKAGTGKSTLLNYYRSITGNKSSVVVLAPTGVSALNVRGQTIHSFFRFSIDVTVEKIQGKRRVRNPELYKYLRIIIIDEVSMVRADLMDCVDMFLRKFGPVRGAPFGGVRMIFVGDLLQLPPIVKEEEKSLFCDYYESPFFFSARVFQEQEITTIHLEKVYRQKNQQFIEVLNRVRSNSITDEDIYFLNSRCDPSFEPEDGRFYITLCSRNKTADGINDRHLQKLTGRLYQSLAVIQGGFGKEYYPTGADLRYKVGAQVMLVSNDQAGRWVNGSIGVVKSVEVDEEGEQYIRVLLQGANKVVTVYKKTWEIYRFSFSNKEKKIVSESMGSFTQLPFRLTWAVTIHKSQGKTFDRVVIDLSEGVFAGGQVYVALSRCSSFEGMVLKSPFQKRHVRVDSRALNFLSHSTDK